MYRGVMWYVKCDTSTILKVKCGQRHKQMYPKAFKGAISKLNKVPITV